MKIKKEYDENGNKMKKKIKRILPHYNEAATYHTNLTGWISRDGSYFGNSANAEQDARLHGCTHKFCDKCGTVHRKEYVVCAICRRKEKNKENKENKENIEDLKKEIKRLKDLLPTIEMTKSEIMERLGYPSDMKLKVVEEDKKGDS